MARQNQISRRHLLWLVVALLAGLMLAIGTASAMARSASPTSPMQVTGHIRGSVRTPGNMPVDGGWIHMRGEAGQPERGAPIAAAGYFSITDLLPGPYTIIAHPVEDSPYAASEPRLVHILSGQWASETLLLTEVRISGYVRDSDSGAGIAGAGVVAHDIAWTVERWDITNVTGEFKIGAVLTGVTYILDAVPPPGTDYVPPLPRPVIPPTTGVVLEMHIPPTNVVGIVHGPTGGPVPGAAVIVYRPGFWLETHADGLGHFLFRGLPTGTLQLRAAPPWGPYGEGLMASEPFTISIPLPDPDVGVITLPPAPKRLTGQVLNAGTGAGIPDAVVEAHRLDGPGFADAPTSPTGAFTLSLPGGEWHVSARPLSPPAPWIFPGPPAWVVFAPPPTDPETKTVTLAVIPTNAWVTGRVVCPDGFPCDGNPPYEGGVLPQDIWVELRHDIIRNGAELRPGYVFTIPIPAGGYELAVHLGHPAMQGPRPIPVFVGPGDVLNVGDIPLMHKNATILGWVRNEFGQGVPGVRVVGWQREGVGQGWAETGINGDYAMQVIPGEWFVEPQPGPDMPYVFNGHPRLVRLAPEGTMAGVDFALATAGARIEGIAVDAKNPAAGRLWGLDGWAWARLFPSDEFFSDAPMRDGGFMLKAQGGADYNVGLNLPPHAPYVSGSTGPVPVLPAAHVFVTVPLEHKDAVIKGRLIVAGTVAPAIGVKGDVFGEDGQGHWVGVGVNPADAWYELGVISGTWHLRARVDPASGYVAVPTTTLVTVQAGQVASPVNFEVWPINALIGGQVVAPDGTTPVGAFVFAEGESPFVGHFAAHIWCDASGHFTLSVPSGVYVVGTGLPPDELEARDWLNPPPVDGVAVSATHSEMGLLLRFRQLDGEIHGTITFAPGLVVTPTHPAYVWGWADTGEWAEAEAVFNSHTATYTLCVVSDTTWHVGAVYEDPANGFFYESPEAVVPIVPPIGKVQQDLVLGGPWPLPHPWILSFDASVMQTIILPDGLELSIPPGALAISGTVTLFILPTQEMRPEPGHEIIGRGYAMWAVDENGQQITQFNQHVTLTFLYPPDAELALHGISEHKLIPVYYSTLVGQWILADSYVVDTVNNLITLQISHFTKFGIMSTREAIYTVYLPLVLRNFSR